MTLKDLNAEVDATLDALEARVRKEETAGGHLGLTGEPTEAKRVDEPPVDLETREPIVRDLRRQLVDSGLQQADLLKNLLGTARWPLLVCHGMTPFAHPGEKPSRVCALGYEARLEGDIGQTLGVVPDTKFIDIATLDTDIELGIDANAALAVPDNVLSAASKWLTLGEISVAATTNNRFALALHLLWTVLDVQAGPLAGGGAKWNLYQRRERLEKFQPLAQIVLVPDGTTELVFTTRTWVKVSGRFFGKDRFWQANERTFRCPLQGA